MATKLWILISYKKKKKTMDLNGNIILIKMFRYNIYVNILLLLIAV